MNNRPGLLAAILCLSASSVAHAQVPGIMYHAHPNFGYTNAMFREHLQFLKDNGFTTITMDQFYEWHANDAPLPLRPIMITVDDNYEAGFTGMYPILQDLDMVATNFIHTRGIGIGVPKATWAQVNQMNDSGHFLAESHSRSHPRLDQILASQLTLEVFGSREDIANEMGGRVTNHFCYPYGAYNQAVIDELIAAGYRTGLTTQAGFNYRDTPIFELRRWAGDGLTLEQFRNAIRFSTYNPLPDEGWIIDDEDPGFYYNATEWIKSTSVAGHFGPGFRYHNPNGGPGPTVRFAALLPEQGYMRVYVRWVPAANRTSHATYTVRSSSGDRSVTVDQRTGTSDWVELGVFHFAEGGAAEVLLSGGSDGLLVADAVWFVPLGDGPGDAWVISD